MSEQLKYLKEFMGLSKEIHIYLNNSFSEFGIGHGQAIGLLCLSRHNNICSSDLLKELKIDKTTIAKSLASLESKRFIKKNVSKEDGRKQIISLTKKGSNLIPKLKKKLNETNNSLISEFSESQKKQFLKLLTIMRKNLKETQV